MGGDQSYLTEKEMHEAIMTLVFSYFEKHPKHADITLDKSLTAYSGLNSAAVLKDHSSRVIGDLASKAADYVRNLGSALSAFKSVPNAVGLVVSFALDVIVSALVEVPDDSSLNMMRRVFAEEKASGVRDTIDEYMKRLSMYLHDPARAQEETKRLEPQLSEQLTSLRNSTQCCEFNK